MQPPLQTQGYDPCMDTGDILHALDDADFSAKMRGYDPFEVDELLDRAAQAIKSLRSDLKSASDRADMAEARLEAELEPAREARTEAEGELSAAGAESRQIRAEAEEEAERIREAAEVELRKAVDDGRRELLAETRDLIMARDAARDDMDMDERQVLAHRDRILSAVFDLTRLAESLGAGTREQGAESGDTTRVDGWDPAGASESGRGL